MTTSGTTSIAPAFHKAIARAYRRAGVAIESVAAAQIEEALEESDEIFKEWDSQQINLWKVQEDFTVTPSQGDTEFDLPSGGIDIAEAVSRNPPPANTDIAMDAISRDDYLLIPDKTMQGRPDRYYVQRSSGLVRKVKFWQAQGPTPYIIVCNVMLRIEDPGALYNDPDISPEWTPAFSAALAHRLAIIHTPERVAMLEREKFRTFGLAKGGDVERTGMTLTAGNTSTGRRK